MKKQTIVKLCNIVSATLLFCFIVKTIIDRIQYSFALNSAPFYVWILVNTLYFVIPAIIIFLIGLILKKKR